MDTLKIIDAVYRRHKIDLNKPKFTISIVNEMIADAIEMGDTELKNKLQEWIGYEYKATMEVERIKSLIDGAFMFLVISLFNSN
jgi:hypothetical protein